MNTQLHSLCLLFRPAVLALAVVVFAYGCGSDDSTSTGNDKDPIDFSPNVDDDIATILAAGIAADNGGAADQLVDIGSLATGEGLRATHLVTGEGGGTEQLIYNASSGTWHWAFTRQYSGANGLYTAHVARTYEWRFLKKGGQPQVAYIHNGDTAYTIELSILSGSGRHEIPMLSHTLNSLSGYLIATGTNTDVMTIDGWWSRAAVDTVRTRAAVRAIENTCSLAVEGMQCPRAGADVIWRTLAGTVTGLLSATIEFTEGDAYAQDSVSREIAIDIDSGMAAITVGDSTWSCEIRHGVIQLPPDDESP
jgi:hypothetical protein